MAKAGRLRAACFLVLSIRWTCDVESISSMRREAKVQGLLGLLLVGLATMLYSQFLWNPIVFDDMPFFMLDMAGGQPVSAYRFAPLELRSLPYATLAWTKAWLGLDLIYFRLGNLLLHAGVVVALFAVLTRLFNAVIPAQPVNRISPQRAAFFAALLFALHPVSTYAVGYLVQRTIVMATLFSVLALLAYVHGSAKGKTMWLWAAVPLYYLAVISKEHAIMLPALLLAVTVLMHEDWQLKLKQRGLLFIVLAVIALCVILAKRGVLGSVYEPAGADMLRDRPGEYAYPLSVLTQMRLFFKYMGLWALPNPAWMSIDMREPFARSLLSMDLLYAFSFVAWGVVACWLLLQRGFKGLAGFALLCPWFLFLTEFSSVRIQEVFVLYRSYLWAVGAVCLLPVLVSRLSSGVATLLLSLVCAAVVPMSMERLMVMSEPLFLWDDAEKLVKGREELPGVYRIYYNRGTSYISLGVVEQAMPDFEKTIALNKDFAEGYQNLGVAYLGKDNYPKAIELFNQAIVVAGRSGNVLMQAHGNLGVAFFKTGDLAQSIAQFTQAIRIANIHKNITAYPYYLGRAGAYDKLGEHHKAQADYQEACTRAKKGCDKLTAATGGSLK